MNEPMMMNPFTGSVDTRSDWLAELGPEGFAAAVLVEVEQDSNGDWQEVEA